MNYHHAYHSGHSADIFKHFTLYLLLKTLTKKEKPMAYLETHAAFAYYDLKNNALTQTTQAYQTGIRLLWDANITGPLENFLMLIKQFNQQKGSATLQFYPGSAWFAHACLRPNDTLYLADIDPEAIAHLKTNLKPPPALRCNQQDGYALLTTWLPPRPARGLLHIDPPYENSQDWQRTIEACYQGYQRWSQGVYVIWYPIKQDAQLNLFYKNLSQLPFEKILIAECCPLAADVAQRLNGSGMAILNPPWQFDHTLTTELAALFPILKQSDKGYCEVRFLKS